MRFSATVSENVPLTNQFKHDDRLTLRHRCLVFDETSNLVLPGTIFVVQRATRTRCDLARGRARTPERANEHDFQRLTEKKKKKKKSSIVVLGVGRRTIITSRFDASVIFASERFRFRTLVFRNICTFIYRFREDQLHKLFYGQSTNRAFRFDIER